jgi:hypothetical protein
MLSPYALSKLIEETKARFFDYTSEENVAEFCELMEEINDEAVEDFDALDSYEEN